MTLSHPHSVRGRSHQPNRRYRGTPSPFCHLNSSREANESKHKLVPRERSRRHSTRCLFWLAVLKHLDLFQGDKPAAHHVVERGQKVIDVLLAVDDLDDQRQVFRQPQYLGGVQTAGHAEAHRPAKNSGAGQVLLPCLQHNRLVKRRTAELVVFSNEDSQQQRLFWYLHVQVPFKRLMRVASTWPHHTAASQLMTETTIYSSA